MIEHLSSAEQTLRSHAKPINDAEWEAFTDEVDREVFGLVDDGSWASEVACVVFERMQTEPFVDGWLRPAQVA